MVYDLANSHAYSSIKGEGIESINALNQIIHFLIDNNVVVPNIEKVRKYSFSEKNGWGNSFDGKSLSKL